MNKTTETRIISAIISIAITYIFILWGGFAFFLIILGLAIAGLLEFYKMCDSRKLQVVRWWGILIVLLLFLNAGFVRGGFAAESLFSNNVTVAIFTLSVIGIFVIQIIKRNINEAVHSSAMTLFGVFYVGWLALHFIFLREIKPYGYEFMLMAVISTWSSDTGAYFFGKKFGKRRLHIASPKKSVEGAFASVLCGIISMFLLRHFLKIHFLSSLEILIIGAVIGIFTVLGDLSASIVKRNLRQKDSGKFLPGHGGVLDRMDSMLFTIPIMYYFVKWFAL